MGISGGTMDRRRQQPSAQLGDRPFDTRTVRCGGATSKRRTLVSEPKQEYGRTDDARRAQSSDRPRGWHTAAVIDGPALPGPSLRRFHGPSGERCGWSQVGRDGPSVELLGQRDDDPLGAADVAEPVAVSYFVTSPTSSAPWVRSRERTRSGRLRCVRYPPTRTRRGSSTTGMTESGDNPPASPPTPPGDRGR